MNPLFVVCFSGIYLKCPVDLLQQDHPHQLVGEGHVGEGQLSAAGRKDLVRKPKRPSYHEHQTALSSCGKSLYVIRKRLRREALSFYGKRRYEALRTRGEL